MTSFENFFNMWEPIQPSQVFTRPGTTFEREGVRDAETADLLLFQQRKQGVLQRVQVSQAERTAEAPERDPLLGIRVTDHADLDLIVRKYGVGGMCFVVWGPNRTTGGWCAAKVPHEALVDRSHGIGNDLKAQFEQEALHWCELWPHPFIVVPAGLTRIARWHDLPALVLEYCPGGSLAEKLAQAHQARRPLSPREAFRWAQQVALGLNAMHQPWNNAQQPLIHCDLKPGNIVLDAHGTARITDLGLARVWAALPSEAARSQVRETLTTVLGAFSANTPSEMNLESFSTVIHPLAEAPEVGAFGASVGTLPYMPPEQWRGLDEVTTASDIYALGIVIFELFAGLPGTPHNPVPGIMDPQLAWYRGHLRGTQRTLESTYLDPAHCGPLSAMLAHHGGGPGAATEVVRAKKVLRELDLLVLACVEKTPASRPTAREVADALADLAEQLGCERIQVPRAFPHIPENEAIYFHRLATIHGHLDHLEKQRDLMQQAVELNPTDAGLEYGYGEAFAKLEQYEEAIRHFDRAEIRINAQQIAWATSITYMLPLSKGNAYLKLARYGDALASYETSLGRKPENAGTLFNMALAYLLWARHAIDDISVYRERLEHGLGHVDESLRHEPDFPKARDLRDQLTAALAQIAG